MSSNRPETSAPPASSEPFERKPEHGASSVEKLIPPTDRDTYIPHVFDLITPTHRARDTAKLLIPNLFVQSEAVDSSLLLGHGASFTVTRQAVPPGPDQVVERHDMGGWFVEKVFKAPKRPRNVVYKAARVTFQENGEPATPQDRRALQSVLTEFHALLHPSLLEHPNIINFLGLAWGSNHAEPLHRLPALVVEYGDLGTLADVQLKSSTLSNVLKLDLCLGIARGLEALHKSGIIHGDVKPENIIICSHKEKTMVPKLADFGFAVIASSEEPEVSIGGTRTWRAPESFSPVLVERLKFTDVYSFGLVAYLVLSKSLQGENRFIEIDRLKGDDQVLALSKFENWIFSWSILSRLGAVSSQISTHSVPPLENPERVAAMLSSHNDLQMSLTTLLNRSSPKAQQESLKDKTNQLYQFYRQQTYFKSLESLFDYTLSKDPEKRDLSMVICLLESEQGNEITRGVDAMNLQGVDTTADSVSTGETGQKQSSDTQMPINDEGILYRVTNTSDQIKHYTMHRSLAPVRSPDPPKTATAQVKIDWLALGFKSHKYSWALTRDLDPSVQSFVVKSLVHLNDASSRFVLCAFFLNGYGVPSDPVRGLECLVEAAAQGHSLAQANLYRVFKACEKDIPPESHVLQYLSDQALRGSRMALQDLKALDYQKGKHMREVLKYGYAGVGAKWFNEDQLHHGLTQSKLLSKEFSASSLGSREQLPDIIVNKRGDYLIHAAAAVGACGLIEELLKDFKFKVNQRNAKGETALLCACRSGHPEIVKVLLDSGASASIQATNGESPLHWLISFDENINVAALGKDLIARGGAKVDAFTMQRVSHSAFPGSLDVDFQMPGTPLMWAVHDNQRRIVSFLLSVGADPNWQFPGEFQGSAISPLRWAAFFHHTECLSLMIEHLEKTADVPMTTEGKRDLRQAAFYGPLVRSAVHASDKFSMILRNGPGYLNNFKATLAFLQQKTKLVNFRLGDETLLHFAASEAHDEACEIILESGWRIDEINKPAGPSGRTPLLESVRWNRRSLFHILRKYGADVKALAPSPYDAEINTWSALHIFADQTHNDELSLVEDLLEAGLAVDGDGTHPIETPFNIAVRRNAFKLADLLLHHGASINTTSTKSSLLISSHPLTGLGHIIALNSRNCFHSLRYMLCPHADAVPEMADFVVEPARNLTALHLCAIVPHGLTYASGEPLSSTDFDWETNRSIIHELLEWYQETYQLNQRCDLQGKTALHLAAEYGNIGVTEELVKAGADKTILSDTGETPADIARKMFGQSSSKLDKLLAWL